MDKLNHHHDIKAHVFRRFFHVVTIILFPFAYYGWLVPYFSGSLIPVYLVLMLCFLVLIFEVIRIHFGWRFYGQRFYEVKRFSAFAWTVVALGALLILSPGQFVTMPIAISCALADPLLGELRARGVSQIVTAVAGLLLVFLIWVLFAFSWWLSALMAIVTVTVEKPKLAWIDDNTLMLLVPLMVYWVFLVL